MKGDVEIVLSYPYQEHATGDRISVNPAEAKRLTRAGIAQYANASDAPEGAPTKRRKE